MKRIILITILIITVIASGFVAFSGYFEKMPDETKEKARIMEFLHQRYNTEFIYDGREEKDLENYEVVTSGGPRAEIDGNDSLIYHFHPADNDKLEFYVTHGYTMTYEVVPSQFEYCYDNFKETIFKDVVKDRQFVYTENKEEELVNAIYDVQTEILKTAKNYNMEEWNLLSSSELDIICRNSVRKIKFSYHDKEKIYKTLESRFIF